MESCSETDTNHTGSRELRQGCADRRSGGGNVLQPSVREAMFPADMTEQRKKLMAMLAAVVNGLGNLETVLPAASALAKRHVTYGAKAEHYPVVGAALLWTLEKGLGNGWTPEVAGAGTEPYH